MSWQINNWLIDWLIDWLIVTYRTQYTLIRFLNNTFSIMQCRCSSILIMLSTYYVVRIRLSSGTSAWGLVRWLSTPFACTVSRARRTMSKCWSCSRVINMVCTVASWFIRIISMWWLGSVGLIITASDLWSTGSEFCRVSTGMGDRLWAGKQSRFIHGGP